MGFFKHDYKGVRGPISLPSVASALFLLLSPPPPREWNPHFHPASPRAAAAAAAASAAALKSAKLSPFFIFPAKRKFCRVEKGASLVAAPGKS